MVATPRRGENDGHFRLDRIEPGKSTVSVKAESGMVTAPVEVIAGKDSELELAVEMTWHFRGC